MVSLTNNDPGAGPPPPGNTGGGESPRRGRRDGPPTRIVRYGAMYWVGEFTHKPSTVLGWGTRVVVQTERGIELGECVGPPCGTYPGNLTPDQIDCFVRNCGLDFCQPRAGRILRAADDQDVSEHRHLNAHVHEDISHCAELAEHLALDLKIVTAEHLLGGERIVFYFRSPTRIDFRQLVKELAQHYRTRIEMRQVGARDEARLVADYEICGRECCCKNFLKKLRPVNMKMAKLQKSTLDPSKVSGRCGRLRCCLRYEHVGYEELAGRLPRPGSRVDTAFGAGTVVDRHVLTQLVAIRTDDERVVTIPLDEIRAFDLPPAPPKPPTDTAGAGAGAAASAEAARRERLQRRGRGGPPSPRTPARPAPGAAPTPAVVPDGGTKESRFRPDSPEPTPASPSAAPPRSAPPVGAAPAGPEAGPGQERGPGRRRRRRRRRGGRGGAPPSGGTGPAGPSEPGN